MSPIALITGRNVAVTVTAAAVSLLSATTDSQPQSLKSAPSTSMRVCTDMRPQSLQATNGTADSAPRAGEIMRDLTTATDLLSSLPTSVASQAGGVLQKLLAEAPFSPHIYTTESGALMLEWIKPDRRFGVFFEQNPTDSGWFFVSKREAGDHMDCGDLGDMPASVSRLLS